MEKQNIPLSEKVGYMNTINIKYVKQAVKEAYEELIIHTTPEDALLITKVFKDKFGFELE